MKIEGVKELRFSSFHDHRGSITEIFRISQIAGFVPLQMTHTKSKPNVLRGLHAQPWNRVVYPATGEVFNVLLDARKDSPTYGTIEIYFINDKDRFGLYIPKGVANGYCITGKHEVDYFYIMDDYYHEEGTQSFSYKGLGIPWPPDNIVSQKDKDNPPFIKEVPNTH